MMADDFLAAGVAMVATVLAADVASVATALPAGVASVVTVLAAGVATVATVLAAGGLCLLLPTRPALKVHIIAVSYLKFVNLVYILFSQLIDL